MKTEKNILIAFLLNLFFSIFECIGGIACGSIAIISDAVHDFGDALSIGISFFLEKKSKKKPNACYTYGYARYSLLGAVITTLVLAIGSLSVIGNAVIRLISPVEINYNGMIVLSIVGVIVNSCAAYVTHKGSSMNQKAVNLHMVEDVLGWLTVLVGAIIMRLTGFAFIDPFISIAVSLFILVHACKNLKTGLVLMLDKIPQSISMTQIKNSFTKIEDVKDVHHIHIWSIDGEKHYATMHIVAENCTPLIKRIIKDKLKEHGIMHATLEFETPLELCDETTCHVETLSHVGHAHHH